MMEEFLPVVCEGQFYYVENRNKNFMHYEVEVQLPKSETDRALWYIKKNLINEAVQSAFPEIGFVGIRTCNIVSNIPDVAVEGGDVVETMDVVEEDMFDGAQVEASDDFEDVERVVAD